MRLSGFSFGLILLAGLAVFGSCQQSKPAEKTPTKSPYVVVLGTVQDGGSPHAGCLKSCCSDLFEHPDPSRMVVSLGLVDPNTNEFWLFEATPDMPRQMELIRSTLKGETRNVPDGIFLTHAHIGHYTGLMYLGRESMNSDSVKVFAMPRMHHFLLNNGPWDQLVSLNNIHLQELQHRQTVMLSNDLNVTPILVPHREEYSETVGFKIKGPHKSLLFIPDINKWEIWNERILAQLDSMDYAFVDATFYDGNELRSRDISQIPHPFVIETASLLQQSSDAIKNKIHFIHFNHTNPLLDSTSEAYKKVNKWGFNIAQFKQKVEL